MTTNQALRWYNGLSLVHDLLSFNDWPCRDARKQAINALDLQPGDTVIDLFCGTGVNFEPILERIGEHGRLIGYRSKKRMKLFILVYLILFYGLAFFWRSYVTWRATGINPYRLTRKDGLSGFLARLYRLISIGVVVSVLLYSLGPAAWYVYLGPLAWLEVTPVTAVGLALLIFALVWVLVAQGQMGASWRIGIDDEHETALVTQGVFRISRNPIFLGMRANLLGLFLVMPNALTLALWLLGDVAIQMQVFLEEEHLHRQHGAAYRQYQAATSRYLGMPGASVRYKGKETAK